MKKRTFLATTFGAAALAPLARAADPAKAPRTPALLTITGNVGKPNRGALDPVRDQMMAKQKIKFDKACVFDFAALAAMPAVTIKPTIEYDNKVHTLSGPLLADVLKAAGVTGDAGKLAMQAVDGYAPTISLADARKYRFIVATHMDGQTMALGGLGPLWGVYEPDRFPEMAAKPISERFALCPWALYHIDYQAD
jgi:hypothetical protein